MRGFFFTRKRTGTQKEYRNTELKDYFQGSIPVFFFIRRSKVNAGKAGREGLFYIIYLTFDKTQRKIIVYTNCIHYVIIVSLLNKGA